MPFLIVFSHQPHEYGLWLYIFLTMVIVAYFFVLIFAPKIFNLLNRLEKPYTHFWIAFSFYEKEFDIFCKNYEKYKYEDKEKSVDAGLYRLESFRDEMARAIFQMTYAQRKIISQYIAINLNHTIKFQNGEGEEVILFKIIDHSPFRVHHEEKNETPI